MIQAFGTMTARVLLDFVNLEAERARARPQPRTGAISESLSKITPIQLLQHANAKIAAGT